MESVAVKRCTKCGEEKAATTEFFHTEPRGADGLRSYCRVCRNIERKARYAPHPKPVRVSIDGSAKTCTRCGETKPLSFEFWYKAERQPGGVMPHCKSCHNGLTNKWKISSAAASYHDARNAHRRTPEERTKINAARRRWWIANPEKARLGNHRYRARKLAAPGKHTAADVQQQLAAQQGQCYWCQKALGKYQVDHLIPLSRGGSDGPENIVCACPTCNLRKHAKMPWEFAGRLL